jgi:hypothetical protein
MEETRNAYRILIGPLNTKKQMDGMNQVNLDKNYIAQDMNLDWTDTDQDPIAGYGTSSAETYDLLPQLVIKFMLCP